MRMDPKTRYLFALGAFRQASAQWIASGRELGECAEALGDLPDDPAALAIAAEVVAGAGALAVRYAGIRQLLSAALEVPLSKGGQ